MRVHVNDRNGPFEALPRDVTSLDEIEGFSLERSVEVDPKPYGFSDNYAGKTPKCYYDAQSQIAIAVIDTEWLV